MTRETTCWPCLFFVSLFLTVSVTNGDDQLTAANIAKYQAALFEQLDVGSAWTLSKGSPDVLVGVIDNGFDFFHPDLEGQLIPGFYSSGGYHTEFFENIAHGTLVSSIIVAKDDSHGITGLAPHCRVVTASQGMIEHAVMKLQQDLIKREPDASLADVQREMKNHSDELREFGERWVRYQVRGTADAIHFLCDHDVKVINISGLLVRSLCPDKEAWGQLENAFAYAAEKDIVIVLAAGNNAVESDDYPGTDATVLIVGACLLNGTRWEEERDLRGAKVRIGSNYGSRLSVMAPVDRLAVCRPHDKAIYGRKNTPMGPSPARYGGPYEVTANGATSSAAPIVTSLVALVRTMRSDVVAAEVVRLIQDGCEDMGEPGYDPKTGHGRVNFGSTMRLATKATAGKIDSSRP